MASLYDKYYASQPGTVKVIIVGAAAALGYVAYRNIKRAKDEADAKRTADAAASELAQLANQGMTASYSDSEFEVFSAKLVEAMNGCGTDENQVYAVFEALRNNADILKLITVFGLRYYQPCAADEPLSYLRWQFDDKAFGGDLSHWIAFDLSQTEIAHINETLRNSGINYQF